MHYYTGKACLKSYIKILIPVRMLTCVEIKCCLCASKLNVAYVHQSYIVSIFQASEKSFREKINYFEIFLFSHKGEWKRFEQIGSSCRYSVIFYPNSQWWQFFAPLVSSLSPFLCVPRWGWSVSQTICDYNQKPSPQQVSINSSHNAKYSLMKSIAFINVFLSLKWNVGF